MWTCPIPWGQIISAGPSLEFKTDHEDASRKGCVASLKAACGEDQR
jgi:hypothetical protein